MLLQAKRASQMYLGQACVCQVAHTLYSAGPSSPRVDLFCRHEQIPKKRPPAFTVYGTVLLVCNAQTTKGPRRRRLHRVCAKIAVQEHHHSSERARREALSKTGFLTACSKRFLTARTHTHTSRVCKEERGNASRSRARPDDLRQQPFSIFELSE